MTLLQTYQQLKNIAPVFLTKQAAALLKISNNHAATLLGRLEKQQTIVRLAQGRWAYSTEVDPLLLPNILSYPMSSYISLYTALYYHGMIEQISSTVFAITNGKTKNFQTPFAAISLHHIIGPLFTGYETYGFQNALLATPEKALFDTLYLMPAKSNLFKRLTELEIPENFNFALLEPWLKHVKNTSRRISIEHALEKI